MDQHAEPHEAIARCSVGDVHVWVAKTCQDESLHQQSLLGNMARAHDGLKADRDPPPIRLYVASCAAQQHCALQLDWASGFRPTESRRRFWYRPLVPKRRKYLSVRLPAKGVSPFHSDRAPSSRMMVVPQLKMPALRV